MNSVQTAVQLDNVHWLVVFANHTGVVATVMDSHDFIDLVANEAQSLDDAANSIDSKICPATFTWMSKIPSPTVAEEDPDRFLKCQEALHIAFEDLVDAAVEAGWKPDEVLVSMIELADNHALMMEANAEVEAALKILKRKGFL
jgi:hypothetical protein